MSAVAVQCCGCWREATRTLPLPSGRVADLCVDCFGDRPRPCVYFIRAGALVKIGYSSQVEKRLKALQTGSAVPLDVWHVEEAPREFEKELHARFKADRAHGEWFHVTDAITEFVTALRGPEEVA